MMLFQFALALIPSGGNKAELQAGKPRKLTDVFLEAVVVLFFSLGPALGAVLFLMWFGGLAWGVISSLFR
jgi:hypothetical protein